MFERTLPHETSYKTLSPIIVVWITHHYAECQTLTPHQSSRQTPTKTNCLHL